MNSVNFGKNTMILDEIKNERKREKRRAKNRRYRENCRKVENECKNIEIKRECHYYKRPEIVCTNPNRKCHHVISNEIATNNLTVG